MVNYIVTLKISEKTMKYILTLLILFIVDMTFAQSSYPDFLHGTWKMENKEVYEHWDILNEHTLKGISYRLKDGQMFISEYLDIAKVNNEVIYTATVLDQNDGNVVHFTLSKTDSTYIFENPNHDFPKKIVYQKLNESEIYVQVSDGKQKGFEYKMQKQIHEVKQKDSTISNPNYNKTLADKFGGDDYGMKNYYLIILKSGNIKTKNKELINESFRGHLNNMNRLVDECKLILAGPLGKNENNYRGIFILNNLESLNEVNELLQTNLAIKNGLLDYEIYTWYGSAALPEYLPISDKIWKLKP